MTARVFQDRLGARAVLVVHPRREQAISGRTGELPGLGALAGRLETRGDRCDARRIRDLACACRPDVVIAAGGDGTVLEVARGLLALPEAQRPDLAILPLGTANNVARSYGLLSVRMHGKVAVERAVLAVHSGIPRDLGVGLVNGQPFVGSFALGIDAAILIRRNALRARMALGEVLGGYPLYLASCAIEALRHRGVGATLEVDGVSERRSLYNLLVTTCAIYAGEFRFDGDEAPCDGRIRAHWFDSAARYLPAYVAAWRRHRRHETGRSVERATSTRLWHSARVCLDEPVAGQVDGEELSPRRDWTVEPGPTALRLRVPATDALRTTSPRSESSARPRLVGIFAARKPASSDS